MWLAVIIFVSLSAEILSYLCSGNQDMNDQDRSLSHESIQPNL